MTFVRLPKRKKRQRADIRESGIIHCEPHLQWVRGHDCILFGTRGHACWGKTEAHHVKTRGAGGGDETAIPACSAAHRLIHDIGIETFEKRFNKDLYLIAEGLALRSPALRKYRQKERA